MSYAGGNGYSTRKFVSSGGPGQHEIVFKYGAPVEAADHLMTFKNLVKTIAHMNGLFASFLCQKPLQRQNGNGIFVNLSLYDMDGNSVIDYNNETGRQFMAGILNHS